MATYQVIWQCKKCATTLQVVAQSNSGGKPNTSGCPQGGSHQWNKLSYNKVSN